MLFPDHPGFEFDTSRILPFLDTYDIEYFDYRDAIDLDQPGALIPVDRHPTAATYEKLAPLLIRDLQQKLAE